MSAIRAGLPRSTSLALGRYAARRNYTNTPFTTSTHRVTSSGPLSVVFAGSGAAGVMGMGLYLLGRDARGIQHSDHNAQQELNPKRKYRDSTSTRWVDWHVKE